MSMGEGSAGARIIEIDRLLTSCYEDRPRSTSSPNLLDGLILTILSQNTSDVNSHRAFQSLKDRFPQWDQAAEAGEGGIEKAIRSGGISRVKAGRIKAILDMLYEETGSYSLEHLRDMEPQQALDGGDKGLDIIRAVISKAYKYLKRNGMIALEIGFDQKNAVERILVEENFKDICFFKDYANIDRVAIAVKG